MRQLLPPRPGDTSQRPAYAPDFMATSVRDIDFALLKERGIRCVALDIDSTLVAHGGVELDVATRDFLRQQRQSGNIQKLALATNRHNEPVLGLVTSTQADVVVYAQGWRRKPFGSYYAHVLQQLGCKPSEAAMVGDKLWQDIVGANRAGLTTILVEPVGPPAWFDRLLLHRWRQERLRRSLPSDYYS